MLVTKFTIYNVKNGYLLNIYWGKQKSESIVFKLSERIKMFAHIDMLLGEEPAEIGGNAGGVSDGVN